MKLFLLIHEQDTDAAWGSSVDLFSTLEAAQAKMKTVYEKTVESWNFDIENQTDDYCCEFSDMDASIRDGSDVEVWRIEEKELDVNIAVKVHGGMVQEVYSDVDVGVEVYDLDSSDFAEESELTETEQRERELDEQIAQPGWRAVW